MTITEDYVSFETAKLLKEKGFNENTPINYFVGDNKPRGCAVGEMIYHKRAGEDTHLIACPTLQMAMKYLREVHKLYCDIKIGDGDFVIDIISLKDGEFGCEVAEPESCVYSTYEEAADAAIKYCLENLI